MIQVLMSTYNGEKYLKAQLESIFSQTYENIKLLIRDDGSIDNTVKIIKKYKEKYEIELIEGENLGVVSSFLELVKISDNKCKYFAFADQDDYWEPLKLEKAVERIKKEEKNGKVGIAYCSNLKLVDKDLKFIKYKYSKELRPAFESAVVENIITGCTLVINKKIKITISEGIGKIDNTKILMHDWYVYILASAFGKVVYDSNSYIKYRQHDNNAVGMDSTKLGVLKRRLVNYKKYKGCRKKHLMEISKVYYKSFNKKQKRIVVALSKDRPFLGIRRQNFMMTIITNIVILIKQY